MSMRMAERNSADAYAGPGKSFPLFSSGKHLHAAWMLAGHAANPDAVRAKIRSFANAHGLSHLLPDTAETPAATHKNRGKPAQKTAKPGAAGSFQPRAAKTPAKPVDRKTAPGTVVSGVTAQKASRAAALLNLAFNHESMEGDTEEKRRLVDFAQTHGLSDALPAEAHGFMHAEGIPHGHEGDENGGAPSLHEHVIQKAVNVVFKPTQIEKAWSPDGSEDTFFEGWVSTEDVDRDRDVVPPECFSGALDEYMARKGPLSSEHNTRGYPVGHAQRLALVRDGAVFKSADHPDDAAAFEHFPEHGTGMYGRFRVTEPSAQTAVKKGNVGGMSWIGNLTEYEPRPGGGRRYVSVYPLLENTIAAYPVNTKAVLTAVKAYEADLLAAQPTMETPQEMGKLEDLLLGAIETVEEPEDPEQEPVTKADLAGYLEQFQTKVLAAIDEKVQKATVPAAPVVREQGAGRVSEPVAKAEDSLEGDPVAYIVKKSRSVTDPDHEFSDEEKAFLGGITRSILIEGMID